VTRRAPLPPAHLAIRVGVNDPSDALRSFDEIGLGAREQILDLLGPDYDFAGKSVLDFGSGPGKVLRHFLDEAGSATFHACDIHEPSIEWLRSNLPEVRAFVNKPLPPLPLEDESIDLALAMSVFTHLSDEWSAWLLELHRVLKLGGLLIASFLGRGMSEAIAGEEWVEDRIGMNVLDVGQDWSLGGPSVLLSPWWIRAHWGRAFEVVRLEDPAAGHGTVLLRKLPVSLTTEDLERPEPDEPRELQALAHQARQLQREIMALRDRLSDRRLPSGLGRRLRSVLARAGGRSAG
jgi:SAM-dependent methyltransferase